MSRRLEVTREGKGWPSLRLRLCPSGPARVPSSLQCPLTFGQDTVRPSEISRLCEVATARQRTELENREASSVGPYIGLLDSQACPKPDMAPPTPRSGWEPSDPWSPARAGPAETFTHTCVTPIALPKNEHNLIGPHEGHDLTPACRAEPLDSGGDFPERAPNPSPKAPDPACTLMPMHAHSISSASAKCHQEPAPNLTPARDLSRGLLWG